MDKINDNFFGVLELDKYEEDVYRVKYVLNDKEVDVIIDYDLVKEMDYLVDFIKDYDNKYDVIKDKIFDDILILKNSDWKGEESNLTREDVSNMLEIEIIEFYGNCSISLWFNDNDLFYGHYVIVDINDITRKEMKISFSLQ